MTSKPHNACPLCLENSARPVSGADSRKYYLCEHCMLIHVDPEHHLDPHAAMAFYRTHENSAENDGYVRFLSRAVDPMLAFLDKDMHGLDYGCGPGPTLSILLANVGMDCDNYDPLFMDSPLNPPYDFIFSTECFEHFHSPAREIDRITDMLVPGGLVCIMTERWRTIDEFNYWYYTRDPTHTVFYHERTFIFICERFGLDLVWQDHNRVTILRLK